MAAPTVAEMLKYANLQMAAEALFDFDTKVINPAILPPGSLTSDIGHFNRALTTTILNNQRGQRHLVF